MAIIIPPFILYAIFMFIGWTVTPLWGHEYQILVRIIFLILCITVMTLVIINNE